MKLIWQRGQSSVRDIYLALDSSWAYTTLMTTLDRLHKKGMLARVKDGRAFLYSPSISVRDFEQGIARDVLDMLLGRGAAGVKPILACIVDTVTEHDHALLDELDRLVKEKREALQEGEKSNV
ncbi:MAG: BlaI/MecI/CopY family transcriptional regulator [Acidobacteria bacterium]|nr:BlaI/MecI/CopY family transcriptional regulator [Acidobacteriota bacterium]